MISRYNPPTFVNDSSPFLNDGYFNTLGKSAMEAVAGASAGMPEVFTDWTTRPDGEVVSPGSLSDDGGEINVAYSAVGQSLEVANGRLECTYEGTSGNAVYLLQEMSGKVRRIGATVGFGPSGAADNAGAIALVAFTTPTPGVTSDAHIHLSMSPTQWDLAVVEDGVVSATIGGGSDDIPRDFSPQTVEMVLHDDVVTIVLPNGRTGTIRHSKFASIQGDYACWEFFNAPGTAMPSCIYSMWADTATSTVSGVSLGDAGRLTERLLATATAQPYPPASLG